MGLLVIAGILLVVPETRDDTTARGLDVLDPLEVRYMPGPDDLEACHELGRHIARRVKGEQD